jgi:hypothetical protein
MLTFCFTVKSGGRIGLKTASLRLLAWLRVFVPVPIYARNAIRSGL